MENKLDRRPGSIDQRREEARLAAVRSYGILDTPPDGTFEGIARLVAQILDAPIAIVSIVDEDRIWFKSHFGLNTNEVPRDPGLCASAILENQPWVIEDAALDPRTLTNPLVAGKLGLRAYAGAQLRTRDGHNLGMLCVLDRKPRTFSPHQVAILEGLAEVIVREMEVRLVARQSFQGIGGNTVTPASKAVPSAEWDTLSPRERDVLAALTEGLTSIEIAGRLSVGPETVKSHIRSIYQKLGVRNRVEAAAVSHSRE